MLARFLVLFTRLVSGMFRLAWRLISVGTCRYFPFCVAVVFILNLFAVFLDSLFGSAWMFVVQGTRSHLPFLVTHGTMYAPHVAIFDHLSYPVDTQQSTS